MHGDGAHARARNVRLRLKFSVEAYGRAKLRVGRETVEHGLDRYLRVVNVGRDAKALDVRRVHGLDPHGLPDAARARVPDALGLRLPELLAARQRAVCRRVV